MVAPTVAPTAGPGTAAVPHVRRCRQAGAGSSRGMITYAVRLGSVLA
ncbi:hypothetical protein ACWEOW_10905 [Monashia sp. NPDC004114]